MANRSRSNQSQDWNPMRDDYNNSTFDPQYPDNTSGGGVQLDHTRLYITSIPKGLTEDGLRSVFSKYGTLREVFLSRDQNKRYGLIKFQTAGQAKLAMMKLNRADPLRMVIHTAHKKKDSGNEDTDEGSNHVSLNYRDDTASIGSRGQRSRMIDDTQLSMNSEGDMDDFGEDELDLVDNSDPDLSMELVQLKMERIKLQEEKLECKRMMILNRAGRKSVPLSSKNRSILSDGRIVVRTGNDRPAEATNSESFGVGSGDALKLPGLQRDASRACVSCGLPADTYCARCAVTPYCSAACQRRDWSARHHAVCHNLARLAGGNEAPPTSAVPGNVPILQPTAPLRRPHSPARNGRRNQNTEEGEDGAHTRNVPSNMSAVNGQASNIHNNARSQDRQGFRAQNNRAQDSRPQNNRAQDSRPQNNRAQDSRSQNNRAQDSRPQNNRAQDSRPQNNRAQDSRRSQNNRTQDGRVENNRSQEGVNIAALRRPQIQNDVEEDWIIINNTAETSTSAKQPVKPATPVPMPDVKSTSSQENILKPLTVEDVTPVKKIVPKTCVIECLSIGDTFLIKLNKKASECRTSAQGYIGVSLSKGYETQYQILCNDYIEDCQKIEENYTPAPGEAFSYYNTHDECWYRARLLTPTLAALLDMSALVNIKPDDSTKTLPKQYVDIPEFSCNLNVDGVKIGDKLKCTLKAKIKDGFKVLVENTVTHAAVGEGEVKRWCPEVEYPVTSPVAGPVITEVARPDLSDKSRVLLVEATDLKRAFVRSADLASQRSYDSVLQDVVLYGQTATPLKEPPQISQVVVAKYTDGLHYRAICIRTNVNKNKYLVEYIEFGNLEVLKLEDLYPCPAEFDLSSQPAVASQVSLLTGDFTVTPPATDYIEKLKDSCTELILTIPNWAKTAPSGAEVKLINADTKECVNTKLEELCTPEWKKMDKIGVDVVETPCIMYSDLEQLELPADGCEIVVLDVNSIDGATVSGYMKGEPLATKILDELPKKLEAYCNSEIGRQPYLPKLEELCIAQCPPYPQWYRAVFCEQVSGAGGACARLCFFDYGNIEVVPVTAIRKMLPEFIAGIPALTSHLEIRDFPKEPTREQLIKAMVHMETDDEGRARLKVTKCTKIDKGLYVVDAPDLLASMSV